MKKSGSFYFLLILVLSFSFSSCATTQQPVLKEKPKEDVIDVKKDTDIKKEIVKETKVFTPTKDEKESLELFSEILDLIESTDDRQTIIPRMEDLYEKIIIEYPEAPLAQESYWKLIEIYLRDYSPPAYDKAEAKYNEFLEKHPKSVLKAIVDDMFANTLYRRKEWGRLLTLCTPVFNEYLDKRNTPRAALMFKCAEANYNLENFEEAERGYKVLVELFPKTSLGQKSRSMLEKIQKDLY